MKRSTTLRIVLAIFFVGLLATPDPLEKTPLPGGTRSSDNLRYTGRRWRDMASISRRSRMPQASTLFTRLLCWMRNSRISCRRSRPWEPQSQSSTSIATDGPISMSPTAPSAARITSTETCTTAPSRMWPARWDIADVNQQGTGVSMGAVWGDYDNDGYEDLFLIKWGRPELFHNEQGHGFTRVTERPVCRPGSMPIPPSGSTTTATACSTCSSVATIRRTSTSGIWQTPA